MMELYGDTVGGVLARGSQGRVLGARVLEVITHAGAYYLSKYYYSGKAWILSTVTIKDLILDIMLQIQYKGQS